jgi:hypothetical protein
VWPYTQDSRSYRGEEADTDHYLVCSKIKLTAKYIKHRKTKQTDKEVKYKIQSLEEPSIINL